MWNVSTHKWLNRYSTTNEAIVYMPSFEFFSDAVDINNVIIIDIIIIAVLLRMPLAILNKRFTKIKENGKQMR